MVLISFEGGECSGKDTQIALLEKKILEGGYSLLKLKEPGSTLRGEIIRVLLKNRFDTEYSFPGELQKSFLLWNYIPEFQKEYLPLLAQEYLIEAISATEQGYKTDTMVFLLYNSKKKLNEFVAKVKQYNCAPLSGLSPAESFFKEHYAPEKLNFLAQMYLLLASRNMLSENIIIPNLAKYDFIILNRFKDSTVVYQGHAQKPELVPWMRDLNLEATLGISPAVTILPMISTDTLQKRLEKRGKSVDFYDNQTREFHEKINQGYLEEAKYYSSLPKEHPEHNRILVIDGNPSENEVFEQVKKSLGF
jgi:thymidylate kinase